MMRAVMRFLLAWVLALPVGGAAAQSISNLPQGSAVNASDLFPATQGWTVPGTGQTRKVSGAMFQAFITANIPTILNGALGSVQGSVAYRGLTGWAGLPPGTAGYVLSTLGPAANPAWIPATVGTTPGGSTGQLQFNNAGAFGGFVLAGDCTLAQPTITCSIPVNHIAAIATNKLLGNSSGSSAVPSEQTVSTGLTFTGGALSVTYGTSSGQALQGSTRGAASGVASLDSGSKVPAAQLPAAALNASLAVPVCPNGVGCLTAATPDIYPIGFAASIAASTVPVAICKVSPAATVTFLVKKWTAGNPATSATLCTGSISTACALSACSISVTSLNPADGLSVEATEASADAAAVISITVPMVKQ